MQKLFQKIISIILTASVIVPSITISVHAEEPVYIEMVHHIERYDNTTGKYVEETSKAYESVEGYADPFYFYKADLGESVGLSNFNKESSIYNAVCVRMMDQNKVLSGTVAARSGLVVDVYYKVGISYNFDTCGGVFDPSCVFDGERNGLPYKNYIRSENPSLILPVPQKAGYIFDGWFSNKSYSGERLVNADLSSNSVTLYAKWHKEGDKKFKINHFLEDAQEDNYRITKTNDEEWFNEASIIPANYAEEYNGFKLSKCVYKGSVFSINSAVSITENDSVDFYYEAVSSDLTIKCGEGSSCNISEGTYKYGKTLNFKVNIEDGYEFSGAYSEVDDLVSTSEEFSYVMPAEKDTVTLETSPKIYNINYVLNGGALYNIELEFLHVYGEDTYLPGFGDETEEEAEGNHSPYVVKNGYSFEGWYLNPDFSGSPIQKIDKDVKKDITVYAKWSGDAGTYSVIHCNGKPDSYKIMKTEIKNCHVGDVINPSSLIDKKYPDTGYDYQSYMIKDEYIENKIVEDDEALQRFTVKSTADFAVYLFYYNSHSAEINYDPENESFYQMEQVYVHTPVVSPVFIYGAEASISDRDPSGHVSKNSATGELTGLNSTAIDEAGIQLVNEKINVEADYQIKVDGSYTFVFDSALESMLGRSDDSGNDYPGLSQFLRYYNDTVAKSAHLGSTEKGYGLSDILKYIQNNGWSEINEDMKESGYNKTDKYVYEKYVRFPFPCVIDGVLYEQGKWISLNVKDGYDYHDSMEFVDFYVPTWAEEFELGSAEFLVTALNADDGEGDGDHARIDDIDWNRTASNRDDVIYNDGVDDYYAYYKIPVQLSGHIYGFTITGCNDADTFDGYKEDWENYDYSFCSNEEDKTGAYNRLGAPFVRKAKTGITGAVAPKDTLGISRGNSTANGDMGVFWQGTTIGYTVKTMGSLYNDNGDFLVIKPSYRYVRFIDGKEDVVESEDLSLFYDIDSDSFVEVGSVKDTSNKQIIHIGDTKFNDSFKMDDLEYTLKHINETQGENYSINYLLDRKVKAYSSSDIKLPADLRIYSGHIEELMKNTGSIRDRNAATEAMKYYPGINRDSSNIHNIFPGPNSIIKSINGGQNRTDLSNKFRKSGQTWFGQYSIPANLYVCYSSDDSAKLSDNSNLQKYYDSRIDGIDGSTPDGKLSFYEYAAGMGKIDRDCNLWLKNGYLVLHFDIVAYHNGVPYLEYDAPLTDQWKVEGFKKKAEVEKGKEITLRSGDIAIIDLSKHLADKYHGNVIMIN